MQARIDDREVRALGELVIPLPAHPLAEVEVGTFGDRIGFRRLLHIAVAEVAVLRDTHRRAGCGSRVQCNEQNTFACR